jgi:type II secretory pathway pseudopilin PulG
VELLVVLAILGLLVAIAAPRLIKYLGSAKSDTAKIQVEKLGGVLDLYRLELGRYPTDQEGLTALVERPPQGSLNGPYLKSRGRSPIPGDAPMSIGRRGSGDYPPPGATARRAARARTVTSRAGTARTPSALRCSSC